MEDSVDGLLDRVAPEMQHVSVFGDALTVSPVGVPEKVRKRN